MNLQLSKMPKHYRRLFNQTSFRTELYVHFAVPEPFWNESFEENSTIRNRGLPRLETLRKDRSSFPKLIVRSQKSDVELAGTTRFH